MINKMKKRVEEKRRNYLMVYDFSQEILQNYLLNTGFKLQEAENGDNRYL